MYSAGQPNTTTFVSQRIFRISANIPLNISGFDNNPAWKRLSPLLARFPKLTKVVFEIHSNVGEDRKDICSKFRAAVQRAIKKNFVGVNIEWAWVDTRESTPREEIIDLDDEDFSGEEGYGDAVIDD